MFRTLVLVGIGSAAALLATAQSHSSPMPADDAVIAEVDGVKLTIGNMQQTSPTALFQAQNSFYDAERKAVDAFIDEYLLERQAKKENVSVDELLRRHVDAAIGKDPDETALQVYYEGLDTAETYEAVRPRIIEHIRQKRMAKAKKAYLDSLRSEAKVAIVLGPPRAPISMVNTPVRGAADAPLTVVEFADYECPYCQQMQPELDKIEAEFKGRIAFAYKDLPLPMHPHAQKAAEAAHCAGAQNRYWEYHDLLLKAKELEIPQLKAGARQIGLDGKAFDACLDSGQQAAAVKAASDEAQKLGLNGTPTFFINGRLYSGVMSYEQMRSKIEEELAHISSTQPVAAKH